ncbi:MAG: hypothetical protein RLZZ198_2213 [Bacteroidota bacterium]|jgi:hypothetical protein
MNYRISVILIALMPSFFAQSIPIEMVRISCGGKYFTDNHSAQPAMLVRGVFCQDSYYYTPIGFGDSLTELAYLNDQLFTGIAEDKDSSNRLIGRYTFKDGMLEQLEEFQSDGKLRQQLNFVGGKQHGVQRAFDRQGILTHLRTFDHGVVDGPFFYEWYGDFGNGLVKGIASKGSYHYEKGFEPYNSSQE